MQESENKLPNKDVTNQNQEVKITSPVNNTPVENTEKTVEKTPSVKTNVQDPIVDPKEIKDAADVKNGAKEPIVKEELMDLPEEVKVNKKISGVGDVIKAVTNAVGIKTCDECEERRKKLNKLFPFTKVVKEQLTEEEIKFIGSIDRKISADQRIELGKVYDRIFGSKTRHCNCPSIYKQMIDRLRIQIDYQNIK